MKKLLLIRADKIGDLVVTLPVDQVFDSHQVLISWGVMRPCLPIVEASVPKRRPDFLFSKPFGFSTFMSHYRQLRKTSFDAVVIFYAPMWVYLLCWMARIPARVGRLSKWYSFLFLNRGVRQSRSLSEKHESEYSLELVQKGLSDWGHLMSSAFQLKPLELNPVVPPPIATDPQRFNSGKTDSMKHSVSSERHSLRGPDSALPASDSLKRIVVHPGMAGSAWNWPAQSWAELLAELQNVSSTNAHWEVFVTCGPNDSAIIEQIKLSLFHSETQSQSYGDVENGSSSVQALSIGENSNWPIQFIDKPMSLGELIAFLKTADVVIAPSTGVGHLAASLGCKVIGIYSPVREHSDIRWGFRGKGTIVIFKPEEKAPGESTPMDQRASEQIMRHGVPVSKVTEAIATLFGLR